MWGFRFKEKYYSELPSEDAWSLFEVPKHIFLKYFHAKVSSMLINMQYLKFNAFSLLLATEF